MKNLDLLYLLIKEKEKTIKYRKRSASLAMENVKLKREVFAKQAKIDKLYGEKTSIRYRSNVR